MEWSVSYKWYQRKVGGGLIYGWSVATITGPTYREVYRALLGKRLLKDELASDLKTNINIKPIGRLRVENV